MLGMPGKALSVASQKPQERVFLADTACSVLVSGGSWWTKAHTVSRVTLAGKREWIELTAGLKCQSENVCLLCSQPIGQVHLWLYLAPWG